VNHFRARLTATFKVCPIMLVIFSVSVLIAGGRLGFAWINDLGLVEGFGFGTPWLTAWASIVGSSLHLYNHRKQIGDLDSKKNQA